MTRYTLNEDALIACVDLVGRTGATGFKFEYTDADPARWWCEAQYKGARIFTDLKDDPGEAAEALAIRILDGGACTHCRKPVAIAGSDPGFCRWSRMGQKWVRGCDGSGDLNRAQRRRRGRR